MTKKTKDSVTWDREDSNANWCIYVNDEFDHRASPVERKLIDEIECLLAIKTEYPGQGHPWGDFLHYRARAIDWLYSDKDSRCAGNDAYIAKHLSMTATQVILIRIRDRIIPS